MYLELGCYLIGIAAKLAYVSCLSDVQVAAIVKLTNVCI